MQVSRIDVKNFRSIREATLAPCSGVNLIVGDNGAGKTSLLEALHLMAHGRSFRGRVRDGLVRTDAAGLEVYVEWTDLSSPIPRGRRAGLRHTGSSWEGRLDAEPVSQLGDLCAALAVTTFEPGSHSLVTGGAESRRRYLDWGLFHVEQAFLPAWRRYSRALRQRNALLKARPNAAQLDAWDRELAESGELLARQRDAYVEALEPAVVATAAELGPSLGEARLEHVPGWRRESLSLLDALLVSRERDAFAGYTSVGPHRADLRLEFGAVPGRSALSRGQAKLAALSVLLGQARFHAQATGDWPVIALDDVASELDRRHRAGVLEWLDALPAQVFISGTEVPEDVLPWSRPKATFHVEHGEVTATVLA
ncbi:DNA replication/repair protein RecF [Cognatilysobacter bugurensis]|uniref:DNA replication and repair protein RecF n=1 Tax=Cognatilysobacter bugurensis TaxID=543356 RepID=A0A918T294_9GAMM|nr:DNA replication/repair protein RecF [Lysobacter bugurensis]GHA86988.1 DNA replication and repair protein RecF [Lysobacter bugurensis]